MLLPLDSLRTDGGTQPRGMIDYSVVEEYATEMGAGAAFPPVVVFFDGEDHWLADGFHRVKAARAADREDIECDVRQGTREDAVWFSCGANAAHGLRRTNADKRRAVETALRLRGGESDRAIAEHCGVGHQLVAEVRRAVEPPRQLDESSSSPKRTGRDGKTRALPAAKPRPAPVPPSSPSYDPDGDSDDGGDADEAPVPAPPPRPAPKPSPGVLSERERVYLAVLALGDEDAQWVAEKVLTALERKR